MSIRQKQDEIVSEFALFDDWMQKYEYMIELGKSLPLISENNKTDDNIIKGCQSKVWLHAELIKEKINFTADSDAIITKGIIALKEHLSPSRANGLGSMIKQLKMYAIAYQTKLS